MRTGTPALHALLTSNQFVKCNLFTFELLTGQTYRWTDADIDVVSSDGRIFSSTGPTISGGAMRLVRGLQVDAQELTVHVKDTDLLAGLPWAIVARSGGLDGTWITVEKGFLPAWGQPAEVLLTFMGKVADVGGGELSITLTAKSGADELNTMVPRLTYQPGCMRTLYKGGCTVSRAAFGANGVVTSVANRVVLMTTLGQPDAFFSLGDIQFVSGANAGVRRSVKYFGHQDGRVELSYPLVFTPQAGDNFVIYAGCDKSRGTNGCDKFGPGADLRFKATPYVPKPESIV